MNAFVQVNRKLLRVPTFKLVARFFDPRRYDLAAVGRQARLTRKLNVKIALLNQTIAEPLVDPETGEILVGKGTVMTHDVIEKYRRPLDGDLNKIVFTLQNDSAVLTEPVVLKFKL